MRKATEMLLKRSDKPIVKTPIHVRITEPNFIDLTLIDLPGLTYREVEDQDLSEYIKNII